MRRTKIVCTIGPATSSESSHPTPTSLVVRKSQAFLQLRSFEGERAEGLGQ